MKSIDAVITAINSYDTFGELNDCPIVGTAWTDKYGNKHNIIWTIRETLEFSKNLIQSQQKELEKLRRLKHIADAYDRGE